jgi:hypothetical protein
VKDTIVMQWLDARRYKHEFATINLSDIDYERSRANVSRLNRPIDLKYVDEIYRQMKDGVDFPGFVVCPLPHTGNFKYEIPGGQHRFLAARKAELIKFDAHIVTEANQFRYDLMCRILNTLGGRRMEEDQQILHVIEQKREFPEKSIKSLAAEWGLVRQTLQNAIKEDDARTRAAGMGVHVPDKTSQRAINYVGKISSDPVFKEAMYCAVLYPLADTTVGLVKEILKLRNEPAQLALVSSRRAEAEDAAMRATVKGGRTTPTVAMRYVNQSRKYAELLRMPLQRVQLATLEPRNLHELRQEMQSIRSSMPQVDAEIDRILGLNAFKVI